MFNEQINWLIKKSNNKIDKEIIIFGLVCGFICGFIFGLGFGLASGFVYGLIYGLVLGYGVLVSLCGIIFFQELFIPIWILIILVLVITEIKFWLDKKKPEKKENKFKFTIKRKLIAFLESSFIIIVLGGLYNLSKKVIPYLEDNFIIIVKWLCYISIGLMILAIIIGIFWICIKLNSLKYSKR